MNSPAKVPSKCRRQVDAGSLKTGDVLVRYGWPVKVLKVERKTHPLGHDVVEVEHEKATICYVPSCRVEVQA